MVVFQGFEAWVTLDERDGARREEYAVEADEQSKRVTCWIASEMGKTFQVCWKAPPTSFHSCGDLYLDGNRVEGKRRSANSKISTVTVHRSYSTSPTTERPYMFSSLEVTDDDAYLSADSSGDIGEIRLQVNRVQLGKLSSPPQPTPLLMDQKVHERSKKAVVHRVGYGEEKVVSGAVRQWQDVRRLGTLVTFVFKYRNLDMLKANGIVQPSPESKPEGPEPSRMGIKRKPHQVKQEEHQDTEEDEDEEEKILLAKLAEVRARRGQKDPNRPLKKVKTEDTPAKMNFTVLPGGVIDLT